MLHVRLVVPFSRRHAVLALLDDDPTVCNLVVAGVESVRPAGELVVFDIPSEAANRVLGVLKSVDLDRLGSISVVRIDTSLSAHAEWAEAIAPGDPGEAVVWDEVDARLGLEAHLTPTFLGMMVVAVLIGAIAVLTDSLVLVVGAMVVGPEFGPLAAATLALDRRRWPSVAAAGRTLAVGLLAGTLAATLLAWALRLADRIPNAYDGGRTQFTGFISHPDLFTVLVAVFAGAAGMIALAQGKSGALVGVLISVTTVPAAANLGVALALGRFSEAGGAATQLGVNLVCLVLVGLATLRLIRRVGGAAQVLRAHAG